MLINLITSTCYYRSLQLDVCVTYAVTYDLKTPFSISTVTSCGCSGTLSWSEGPLDALSHPCSLDCSTRHAINAEATTSALVLSSSLTYFSSLCSSRFQCWNGQFSETHPVRNYITI